MKSFRENVIDIVKSIPKGSVMSYKEVAKCAGNQNASRAIGTIMANNQDKNVPCHRVIKSDGTVGAYNGLQGKNKTILLVKEGVQFLKNGKVQR